MALSREQLVEMLENDEDTDLWLLNADGTTSIVPDTDITRYQTHSAWPRYICRSESVNMWVNAVGVDQALTQINMLIESMIITPPRSMVASVAAAAARLARRSSSLTERRSQ